MRFFLVLLLSLMTTVGSYGSNRDKTLAAKLSKLYSCLPVGANSFSLETPEIKSIFDFDEGIVAAQTRLGPYGIMVKVDQLLSFEKFDDLQAYLFTKPIPWVMDEGNKILSDRHHTSMALIMAREELIEKFGEDIKKLHIYMSEVKIADKYRDPKYVMDQEKFEYLKKSGLYHTKNIDGTEFDWKTRPKSFSLEELKMDPYRGLAWVVFKAKVLNKKKSGNDVPFIEFFWAEVFQKNFEAAYAAYKKEASAEYVKAVQAAIANKNPPPPPPTLYETYSDKLLKEGLKEEDVKNAILMGLNKANSHIAGYVGTEGKKKAKKQLQSAIEKLRKRGILDRILGRPDEWN